MKPEANRSSDTPNAPFMYLDGTTRVLVDLEDVPWAVFDCWRVRGRLVELAYESPDATHRVFEPVDGQRRIYEFAVDEPRATHPARVSAQLKKSQPLDESDTLYPATREPSQSH